MSDSIANIQPLTPGLNQQAVYPPTSTAQTDAQLTTTGITASNPSEPTLSNKEAPKSPLDSAADPNTVDSSVLEHSAPESRVHSASTSQTSTPNTTAAHVYSTLSMTALTEAASAGAADAQFELGKRFYQGVGVPVNHEDALKWYTQSAEQGYFKAQHNLGQMYFLGKGVEKDKVKAAEYYKMAANQGSAVSQYTLALLYKSGEGVEKNDVIAFSWCLNAADQGYAEAQWKLGMLYQSGQGVNPDSALEHTWFSKASDQGHSEAQYELARIYLYGRKEASIDKDVPKAIDLFLKSANQGLAKAQCHLGCIYRRGTDMGIDKDYDKAIYWLRLAADQGNFGGQATLADMYKNGHGVKQSYESAVFWYAKAAVQGDKHSQRQLSLAYKDGKGVKKDLNRSVYWQIKHSLNDDGDCIKLIDISLSAGLTNFIVSNLNDNSEFKRVTKFDFTKNEFSDDEILAVCKLIRKNLSIQVLVLDSFDTLSDKNLQLIIEALDVNTQITEFEFNEFFADSKIIDKIAALLARNVAIAELRKYVQDYPLKHTASFALDPLKIIIDRTIISYMVNGISKEETKKAIDELLLSASIYELEAEVKSQVKQ